MKRRDHRQGKGPPPGEMVVCFPAKAHLSLMPKPICSPARPTEMPTRGRHRRRHSHHFQGMRSSSIRGAGLHQSLDISEPSSPKVTCAGQIKVRPRRGSCRNWRSVMEEFERMQGNRKLKKRSPWSEAFRFVTCLRSLRLDFRCFGAPPEAAIDSDEDEEAEDDGEEAGRSYRRSVETDQQQSGDVFSNWFMILEEGKDKEKDRVLRTSAEEVGDEDESESPKVTVAPPANALVLMRCRSAPAKSWQEEDAEEKATDEQDDGEGDGRKHGRLVVMKCGGNFSRFSADVVQETWLVGGTRDTLSRNRSSKR